MRLKNYTPFPMLCYESRGIEDAPFDTVVVRVTLELGEHRVLRLSQDQTPLAYKDEYLGEPIRSSVRTESDIAPAKPCSDIIVVGSARAPGGAPRPSWPVVVKVGTVEKRLRVTGPRAWVRGEGGFTLTEPEPCTEVPMRYELAFGGVAKEGEREVAYEANPLGVGFAPPFAQEGKERIEAPRIEALDEPVTEIGKSYRPQGVGVWGRTWPPRVQRAGTYDDTWKKERWPKLPADFDFKYWNSAHPDLIAPGLLRGDEEIVLSGFDAERGGVRRHRLPGHTMFLAVGRPPAEPVPRLLFLDTLVIDLERAKVVALYRGVLPWPRPESLEVRMQFRDPAETEARMEVADGK
jgi:hypothetical protein